MRFEKIAFRGFLHLYNGTRPCRLSATGRAIALAWPDAVGAAPVGVRLFVCLYTTPHLWRTYKSTLKNLERTHGKTMNAPAAGPGSRFAGHQHAVCTICRLVIIRAQQREVFCLHFTGIFLIKRGIDPWHISFLFQ